jgi:glycosyltransferase involved in cell wall biosynthesis
MRAIHVIAGLRPEDGGPAYSVPRLCRELAAAGAQVELMSVAGAERDISDGNYRERYFSWSHPAVPVLGAARASAGLAKTLRREAPGADVIHNHGLWLMPNVYAGSAARFARRPLIVAPRGMLSRPALSFSPAKKRAFWLLLQRRAVNAAICLHATSEQEYEEIRAFGLQQPVAIIPNGIDIRPDTRARPVDGGTRTILSLGRIHPKKGLDILLRAWARRESEWPEWRLRIVGPGENGHDSALKALAKELGLSRVSIEGPLYGEDKYAAFEASDLFVLPTLNDNFAVTVAEALAAGVPVVASKGAPWRGLLENRCGWWTGVGVDELASALASAMAQPSEALAAMGARGRAWMARDFSWRRAGQDMIDLYQWLARSAARPSFVRVA